MDTSIEIEYKVGTLVVKCSFIIYTAHLVLNRILHSFNERPCECQETKFKSTHVHSIAYNK